MSENGKVLDFTKKTPPEKQMHAPYICPHCEQPADSIGATLNPRVGMIVFWHGGQNGCNKVLGCQMLVPSQPQKEESRIVVPGVTH